MSKGSKRRPRLVDSKTFDSNWNKIFGRVSSSEQSLKNKSDVNSNKKTRELGGRKGPEPTRYGDWEKSGRCIDF